MGGVALGGHTTKEAEVVYLAQQWIGLSLGTIERPALGTRSFAYIKNVDFSLLRNGVAASLIAEALGCEFKVRYLECL